MNTWESGFLEQSLVSFRKHNHSQYTKMTWWLVKYRKLYCCRWVMKQDLLTSSTETWPSDLIDQATLVHKSTCGPRVQKRTSRPLVYKDDLVTFRITRPVDIVNTNKTLRPKICKEHLMRTSLLQHYHHISQSITTHNPAKKKNCRIFFFIDNPRNNAVNS